MMLQETEVCFIEQWIGFKFIYHANDKAVHFECSDAYILDKFSLSCETGFFYTKISF